MNTRHLFVVVALAATGCVHDTLVHCGDQLCPAGFLCDAETSTCVDPSGLSVPEGAIDFAAVGCGSSSEIIVPMRNFGATPIDFRASSTVSGVSANPSEGTLPAGGAIELHVVATAPAQSIPGLPVEGSLVIDTGHQLLGRTVRLTTVGALMTTSEQALDFGESGLPGNVTRSFSVLNSGNEQADLSVTSPSPPFALPSVAPLHFSPGELHVVDVAFQPQVINDFASSLALTFSGSQCQPPPESIPLTGSSTAVPILADHLLLDFGTAACGAAPSTLMLGLTSNLGVAQTVTPSLSGPDRLLFDPGSPATLPAGPSGMVTLPITRLVTTPPMAVGSKSATLTISASPSGTTKVVSLTQLVSAPVLDILPVHLDWGSPVPENTASVQFVVVTNSGNAVANVSVNPPMLTYPGVTRLAVSPVTLQIPAMSSSMVSVTLFAGTQAIDVMDATFTFSAPGMCAAGPKLTVDFSVM